MADQPLAAFLGRLRDAALRQDGAMLTDGELLDRFIARREEGAFEALVRRHGPMVLGVCRRILGNEADAEDAFQATFLVLTRRARCVRPRAMVGNWLHGVARNTALRAKAMRLRRQEKERTACLAPRHHPPDGGREELLALLDRELAALPEKYRAPLILCELEGQTLAETARQLGWPQGTLATRLARARALLGRRLVRRALALSGAALLAQAQESASAGMAAPLVVSTVQAAAAVAAGQAAVAAVTSANVAALTEGMVKAMRLTTLLRTLAAMLLGVILLGGGGLLLARHTPAAPQNGAPGVGQPAPAPDEKARKDDKAKSDKDLLQGTWVEESRGAGDGEKVAEEKRWKLVFDGDKVTWLERGKEREGTFTIDPEQKPKEIDLSMNSPTLTLTGIYELKDDTLKTLWRENDRGGLPKTFDAKEGVLIVFKKQKK
jgi:RNA polymerase sigma factor (sigma-70 family)